MDKEALAALRQGFRKAARSPDVQNAMSKIYGTVYDYVPPEEIEAAFDKLRKIDARQAAFWKARLNAAN